MDRYERFRVSMIMVMSVVALVNSINGCNKLQDLKTRVEQLESQPRIQEVPPPFVEIAPNLTIDREDWPVGPNDSAGVK